MTSLPDLLAQLEDAWARKGAPPAAWLAPGLAVEEVERELGAAAFGAPAEIVEWFGWHNGTIDTTVVRNFLGPTGWWPFSLAGALEERTHAAEISAELNEEGVPSEWEPGWLPIARELGMGLLLADLSQPESDQLPVVTYYWDSEPEEQTASIADAVRVWIDVLTKYAIWLPDEGRWETQFDQVPTAHRHVL